MEQILLPIIQIAVSSYDVHLEVNILTCCYLSISIHLSCVTNCMKLFWLLKQMMRRLSSLSEQYTCLISSIIYDLMKHLIKAIKIKQIKNYNIMRLYSAINIIK